MQFGTLCDYQTGVAIRPATQSEHRDSLAAAESNIGAGTGVIEVDGRRVYVADDCCLAEIAEYLATLGDSALQDIAEGRWDEVMTDSIYEQCEAEDRAQMAYARQLATTEAAKMRARKTQEDK